MGYLNDLWRLMRAAQRQSEAYDRAESLREAADLAEAWAGLDPNQPLGTHGAMTANPYANLSFLRNAIPAAGTVMYLVATEERLGDAPIHEVGLEITMDGREPYGTIYRTVIAAGALPNWQPGRMLTFRVSPDDPHSIMLG